MFVYHNRFFNRYNREVCSLAILADDRPQWRPNAYGYDIWGCRLQFGFPIVKLLDLVPRLPALVKDCKQTFDYFAPGLQARFDGS